MTTWTINGDVVLGIDSGVLFTDGRLSGSDNIDSTSPTIVAVSEDPGLADATYTYSGLLSGTLRFSHTFGTLEITGANTHTGGVRVVGGTLLLDQNTSAGTGSIAIDPAAILVLNGTMSGAGALANDIVLQSSGAFEIGNAFSTVQIDGVIAGASSGDLSITGGGTTIFNATNTYQQSTSIAAGTRLQIGTGGTTGTSGAGAIVDDGTLIFDRSDTMTIANAISGAGVVRQEGAGTTILTADNTYGGRTYITSGTLQIGAGGTSGAIGTNLVINDGELIINRSDAVTISNTITGSGAFTQSGAGTTILTGAATYSGTTTISAGTLQVGDGGMTGGLTNGVVVNNGNLAFNHSNAYFAGSTISGTGKVTQLGSGALTLSHASTYSGGTDIYAGTIEVAAAGALGTGQVTFKTGAQTLALDAAAFTAGDFSNTIVGFASDDTIDLAGITATSATLGAGNVLSINTTTGTKTLHLDAAQSFAGQIFAIASDGSGGSNLTLAAAPVVTPVATPVNPWTENSVGGHDTVVTDPNQLGGNLATRGIDLLLYSIMQPLSLPTGIENISLGGSGGRNVITGNELDNRFDITSGDWSIDGRGGSDTVVYAHQRANYSIATNGYGATVAGPEGTQIVSNVETLRFADKMVIFDQSADASLVFSLYQAALGRVADADGMAFWLVTLHSGHTTRDLANAFIASTEFQTNYGAATTDATYVAALYQNVLRRPADAAGSAYWMDRLAHADRAELLIDFAASAENQNYTKILIGQGVMTEYPIAAI